MDILVVSCITFFVGQIYVQCLILSGILIHPPLLGLRTIVFDTSQSSVVLSFII